MELEEKSQRTHQFYEVGVGEKLGRISKDGVSHNRIGAGAWGDINPESCEGGHRG